MKTVVVREVHQFLKRPSLAARARYYAIVFLNQIVLARQGDAELAATLVGVHLELFADRVTAGDVDTRLLSALLTGVNRAFPYMDTSDTQIDDHIDELYRVVHKAPFNTVVQALMLLFQVVSSRDDANRSRFYRALYAVLLAPDLASTNKAALFLNLLYRAMKVRPPHRSAQIVVDTPTCVLPHWRCCCPYRLTTTVLECVRSSSAFCRQPFTCSQPLLRVLSSSSRKSLRTGPRSCQAWSPQYVLAS